MRQRLMYMFSLLVLLGLAALFGVSSTLKAMDVASFEQIVESHEVLPKSIVPMASIAVICVEALLAMLCIAAVLLELTASKKMVENAVWAGSKQAKIHRLTSFALLSAAGLLAVFTIYALVLVALNKNPIECGCGVFGKTVVLPKWIAIRNAIAAGLVFLVFLVLRKQRVARGDEPVLLSGSNPPNNPA